MYPCGKLKFPSATILIDRKAVRFPSLNPIPPPPPAVHPSPFHFSFLARVCLISEMEQPSSFRDLFNAALKDYQNQTGNSLVDHPFAKQLESCDSADSITAILQEQAQIFRDFRGDDGKFMKSLKCSVNILYTLSAATGGIGVVHPKPLIRVPCF